MKCSHNLVLPFAKIICEKMQVKNGVGLQHRVECPEVIKLFSSSAQLSMKFQLLINVEIVKIGGKFRIKTQKLVIYPAHKC